MDAVGLVPTTSSWQIARAIRRIWVALAVAHSRSSPVFAAADTPFTATTALRHPAARRARPLAVVGSGGVDTVLAGVLRGEVVVPVGVDVELALLPQPAIRPASVGLRQSGEATGLRIGSGVASSVRQPEDATG